MSRALPLAVVALLPLICGCEKAKRNPVAREGAAVARDGGVALVGLVDASASEGETPVVSVNQDGLWYDGRALSGGFGRSDDGIIPALYDTLMADPRRARASIVIAADKDVSSEVLNGVIKTASKAGYSNVMFAVASKRTRWSGMTIGADAGATAVKAPPAVMVLTKDRVTVRRDGNADIVVASRSGFVDKAGVDAALRKLTSGSTTEVFVAAESDVPYQMIIDAMDTAVAAGLHDVLFTSPDDLP